MPSELVTDLETMRRLAFERQAEFDAMRKTLEDDETMSDEALDTMIDELAQPIIAAIDCKQCANCCRSLDVCLTIADVARMSRGLHIPVSTILNEYVDKEHGREVGEWATMKTHPCPFLRGKLCSIYEHRPESCRIYPVFTPDFRYNLEDTIEGASYCPIIYNVLTVLAEKVAREF